MRCRFPEDDFSMYSWSLLMMRVKKFGGVCILCLLLLSLDIIQILTVLGPAPMMIARPDGGIVDVSSGGRKI